jgi:hypothetical protein
MAEQSTITLPCPNCGRSLEVDPESTKPLRCGSYAEQAGCLLWLELRYGRLMPVQTPPRSQR